MRFPIRITITAQHFQPVSPTTSPSLTLQGRDLQLQAGVLNRGRADALHVLPDLRPLVLHRVTQCLDQLLQVLAPLLPLGLLLGNLLGCNSTPSEADDEDNSIRGR